MTHPDHVVVIAGTNDINEVSEPWNGLVTLAEQGALVDALPFAEIHWVRIPDDTARQQMTLWPLCMQGVVGSGPISSTNSSFRHRYGPPTRANRRRSRSFTECAG